MAETKSLEAECIAWTRLPGASPLFLDFLYQFDKVSRFYASAPRDLEQLSAQRIRRDYPQERRDAVAAVLERQNREFGSGVKMFENLQRLREGAPVIVTGQQVGLFGGPLFSILKALTAVMQAERVGAVPVFWMAAEDHDIAEIRSVDFPAGDHVERTTVSPAHPEGAQAGVVFLDDEITSAMQQTEALLGNSTALDLLKECYRPGETFASAFAKFFARLFTDHGLVLLHPGDAELHRIAQPVYRESLVKNREINERLQKRTEELESSGYHVQVKVTPSHTLCFYVNDGVRTPVRNGAEGFLIGERRVSEAELIAEAERCPERFSANVLLRPVVQDYLLPTLCYIGGPAEIAYFAQASVVYEQLLGQVTPVIPRISATLLESRSEKLLHRYQLTLEDVFRGPEKLRELLAEKTIPQSVLRSFDEGEAHLEQALQVVRGTLEKLDSTLVDAADNAGSKMRHQLQSLREKAVRAEARKNAESQRHADELSTLLYPGRQLQERGIGAAWFLLKYGTQILQTIKAGVHLDCLEHQVIGIRT